MKENEVLYSICEYLEWKKYFFYRNNNTAIYDPTRQCFRALPKYAIKGVADIVLLSKGSVWFIEAKTAKPKTYQSKDQKEFEKKVIANGGNYLLARSIDDLIKAKL